MDGWSILVASGGAFVASWAGTLVLIRALGRGAVLDHPNERSSHAVPVPRGGGIAIIATVAILWTVLAPAGTGNVYWILVAAIALAAVSWIDDLHDLSILVRLPVHFAAVIIGLFAIGDLGPVFQGVLPLWLDRIATVLLWVWFLNLFNFMDGIDGLAAGETVAIALGLVALAVVTGGAQDQMFYAATLAATTLGFWWWNAAPARIFLGDVGSIPLGFVVGWLLLTLAAHGHWVAALILPLYFLCDSSLTLLKRLQQGARVWQPHREHYYQRAVQNGITHAAVVRTVMAANLVLIVLAVVAVLGGAIPAGIAALATVAMLLFVLSRMRPRP
ncbi:MAG: glycosyltransferase family 4 protein [Alphaproteobacteria bacterium]|nr:glycosyltransferase family 4 protein [Alphaproteobacteria bacterium]